MVARRKLSGLAHLHLGRDQVRDLATIFFLRVPHQGERTVVDLDDVLFAVFADEKLDGANVQTSEKLADVVHPGTMSLRHSELFQHRGSRVGLPVSTDALAPEICRIARGPNLDSQFCVYSHEGFVIAADFLDVHVVFGVDVGFRGGVDICQSGEGREVQEFLVRLCASFANAAVSVSQFHHRRISRSAYLRRKRSSLYLRYY